MKAYTKIDHRSQATSSIKRFLLPIVGLTLFASASFAQVTVTNPGNTTPGLSATYTSLALAITDLNAQTAISGPVIITLTGNETAPAGGYSITALPTGASTTNNITIQGSSSTITAFAPQASGNLNDAIFKIIGADFITIQNFTMQENAANTTTAAGTNNMTEWGVALLYASTTNGAQNCIIQNNIISLNRTYQNTFGIYSNSTHSATAVTTSVSATTAAGGNSGMKVYGNMISNVNQGIVVVGPTAAADMNTGIDIGGAGGGQANILTNFGTTGSFSGYANVSATVNGILVRNSVGFNVSFNTVTSSVGGTTTATLNGIQVAGASATPTGTFTNTINSNNISLQSGLASGAMNGIVYPSGSASTTSVLNINSNNFNTFGHTVAASGVITFISVQSTNLTESISNNTFTNMSVNTTGGVTFISNSYTAPAGGTKTINSNSIVTGFAKTGAGGPVTGFSDGGLDPNGVVHTNNNNNFSNISVTGATSIVGWINTNGFPPGPTKTITGNTFSNWTGGLSGMTALSVDKGGDGTNVSNNTISNITYAPTAANTALTGISVGATNGGAAQTYSNNTISGLSSTGAGGQLIGIFGGSTTITTLNINNNTVSGLSTTASAGQVVAGIYNQSTGPTVNIFNNKVYDVVCSPGAVIGINSTATAATNTINIYNNIVGRLYASTSGFFQAARGLSLATTAAATYNLFYNTVYLDGTTPGQTYCVYIGVATNNVPNVNPIDNIFVNNVTSSNGATLPQTVYFRFGTTTATNLASTANNNLLYAGTPAVDHLIYVDGAVSALTNPQQTLANYKTFVGAREGASFTGLPPFLNTTTGSSANYLHIDPTIATLVESGGIPITSPFSITDDYDGDTRNATTPDVGADEGNFTAVITNDMSATAFISPTNGGGLLAGASFSPQASFTNNGTTAQTSVPVRYRICTDATCTATPVYDQTTTIASLASGATATATFASTSLSAGSYTIKATAQLAGDTVPANDEITGTITVQAPLNGGYTVGSGGAYNTLTEATTALNSFGVTGPVTFTLTAGYAGSGETFPVTINAVPGASATNTVTIKPDAGVSPTIGGSSTSCIIELNGADYVTIDGSNTVGGTTRDLTITNTSASSTTAVVCVNSASASDGATNNTIKNCNVSGNAPTTTLAGIISGSGTTLGGVAEAANANNTYQNNAVTASQYGIALVGPTGNETGNAITGNAIGSAIAGSKIGFSGIAVFQQASATVGNNVIAGVVTAATSPASGIIVSGTTNGILINANKVSDVKNTNTGTYGAYGIDISSGDNVTVTNNFVSDINHDMTGGLSFSPTFGVFGIIVEAGIGHQVYFNSVNLSGVQPGAPNSALLTAAFAMVSTGSTGCDVRDNIFANNITGGTTSIAHVSVYLPSGGTAAMSLTDNNNAYYFGTDPTTQGVGQAGTTAGTNFYTTLPALKAYSSTLSVPGTNDNASLAFTAAVPFISADDLHITCAAPVADMATPIGSVTTDIDGQPRSLTAPDIGADEITAPVPVSAVSRKAHGFAGPFDINLPLSGPAGVECRSGGATNDYEIVVTFASPVTVGSAAVTSGVGSVMSASGSGTNTITVDLTGVANAQYLTVGLNCVDNGLGASGNMSVTVGVLVGDTGGNGSVNSADIGQTKAQSGNAVTGSNFREDVNLDGNINASDVGLVKSKSGTALP